MLRTVPLIFVLLTSVSLTTTFAGTDLAKEPNRTDIRMSIENIQFNGNDSYSIVVSAMNASPKDIRVSITEEGFFIQTDRGWTRLRVNGTFREGGELLLPHDRKNELTVSIIIPQTIPDLFRTYDGNMSLMYKYKYSVWTMDGTGTPFQRADEIYCWVKPKTSQWILREGM